MTAATESDLIPIEDVNDFAQKTIDWHTLNVHRLEHMMKAPEGTAVSLDDGEDFVLEGEKLKAFRLGIQVALYQLGTLPFVAEYERND